MKGPAITYRFILLASVSVVMLFFFKINKMSFYHHFFRVIEEVGNRNSQEVASIATFDGLLESLEMEAEVVQDTLSWMFGFLPFLVLIILDRHFPTANRRSAVPIPVQIYRNIPPTRAP
ncbi:hypothetical protein [Pontibacter sp. G13]|uniref:hypothetical protein n=1 Tax=Pontibacter sp. G13 TaxID=3074898 RepID=UPI00288A5F76|nr:hypothetical protein [Pontibacter sp. G13]WNJ17686.1 hypothetical protein RJD25_22775 [Pontibacter sp. G13]